MPSTATLSAPSVQRVASCFAAYAVALPPDHEPFQVTRDRLTAEAGLPLRTLARALSVLSEAGVIEQKRGRFRILDASRLKQLAGGDASRSRKANMPPATLDVPPNVPPVALDVPPAAFDGTALATLQGLIVSLRAEVSGLRAEVADLKANVPPVALDVPPNVPPAAFDGAALVAPIVEALNGLRAEVSGLRAEMVNKPSATQNVPPATQNVPPAEPRTAQEEGSVRELSRANPDATEAMAQLQALVDRAGGKQPASRLLGISESGVRHALKRGVSTQLASKVAAALLKGG